MRYNHIYAGIPPTFGEFIFTTTKLTKGREFHAIKFKTVVLC